MKNYSNSSNKYLKENVEIYSLKFEDLSNINEKRIVNISSISGILINKINNYTLGILRYIKEIILNLDLIFQLNKIQNTKKNKKAIVIGNGPSQGFIDLNTLEAFKKNGNDIFVVNYWHQNILLSKVIPTYIVISDPNTLRHDESEINLSEYLKNQNHLLLKYLCKNECIKIIAPISRKNSFSKLINQNRFVYFVDTELRWITSNIDPRFPRGYVSMTLYKALSFAIHLGYYKIYIIGMDNTYSKDIYCDNKNRILRKERHVSYEDYIVDMTNLTPSMDVLFQDIFNLFYDLRRCFRQECIINLDCYSLTDVFKKIENIDIIDHELTNNEISNE